MKIGSRTLLSSTICVMLGGAGFVSSRTEFMSCVHGRASVLIPEMTDTGTLVHGAVRPCI